MKSDDFRKLKLNEKSILLCLELQNIIQCDPIQEFSEIEISKHLITYSKCRKKENPYI